MPNNNWCIELHVSVFVAFSLFLPACLQHYLLLYVHEYASQFVFRSDSDRNICFSYICVHSHMHMLMLTMQNEKTEKGKIRLPSPKQIIWVKTLPPKNGKTGYYREFMKTTFRALTLNYSSRNIFRFGKTDLCAINLRNVFIQTHKHSLAQTHTHAHTNVFGVLCFWLRRCFFPVLFMFICFFAAPVACKFWNRSRATFQNDHFVWISTWNDPVQILLV